MAETVVLRCDGCGQVANAQHMARRLTRLAWTTRFRPIHIQALVLAGLAPQADGDFLYTPEGAFGGEAARLLQAAAISAEGKARETALGEFQKLGLMLVHVLECPLEDGVPESQVPTLIDRQLGAAMARIRRSLKPKRVVLVSRELAAFSRKLHEAELGCMVLPEAPGVFFASAQSDMDGFRAALAVHGTQGDRGNGRRT
jgi:hypothetical protein